MKNPKVLQCLNTLEVTIETLIKEEDFKVYSMESLYRILFDIKIAQKIEGE